MANIFIKKQLDFIINNTGKTDIYEIDKIRYGLEVFYGEISKLLVMMLIALILDKLPSFFIMITLLTLIRPHVGGSHAKSFISCMIQSNLLFLIVYFLASIIPSINIFLQFFIIVFSIIIIRKFKPINPLRKTVHTQYKNLKFKNIVTLTLITWFIVSNLIFHNYYINCGILIILYIIFDFLREVYKNEKKING